MSPLMVPRVAAVRESEGSFFFASREDLLVPASVEEASRASHKVFSSPAANRFNLLVTSWATLLGLASAFCRGAQRVNFGRQNKACKFSHEGLVAKSCSSVPSIFAKRCLQGAGTCRMVGACQDRTACVGG